VKQKQSLYKFMLGLAMLVSLWTPLQLSAQTPNSDDDPSGAKGIVQCGNRKDDPCTVEDIFNLIVIITNFLIGLAGLIVIISIVAAGFQMVFAAGGSGIEAGKKRFSTSLIGLVLVLLAFVLANVIFYGTLGEGVFQGILNDPGEFINQ
jgi:hypothetical protein